MKNIEVIERQLERVLAFFPRVEARISALFGVNTLIFAVAAVNVSAGDFARWYVVTPGALLIAGLVTSYVYLFRANFPDDNGGEGSLVFFKAISDRTEANYLADLLACSDDKFRDDLIGQVWRNSVILCAKYRRVKKAISATALSIVPFIIFLAVSATIHHRVPYFKADRTQGGSDARPSATMRDANSG